MCGVFFFLNYSQFICIELAFCLVCVFSLSCGGFGCQPVQLIDWKDSTVTHFSGKPGNNVGEFLQFSGKCKEIGLLSGNCQANDGGKSCPGKLLFLMNKPVLIDGILSYYAVTICEMKEIEIYQRFISHVTN